MADIIDALDLVVWYNGMGEDVSEWKVLPTNKYGSINRPDNSMGNDQLEMLWMICVCLFGNYGTSPRSGWIEDVEAFRKFVDAITKTDREAI